MRSTSSELLTLRRDGGELSVDGIEAIEALLVELVNRQQRADDRIARLEAAGD